MAVDKYKVLWVDDQEFTDIEDMAFEEFDIELVRVESWEEAEPLLKKSFDLWCAIILDCYCKRTKEGLEDEKFLKYALHRLDKIAGDKRVLPWYVLSAGNREDFSMIIDQQLNDERLTWDADWEQIYYSKTSKNRMTGKRDIRCLLENIHKVVVAKDEYSLRALYADVLKVFPAKEAELVKILKSLKPSEYQNLNCLKDIRDILEYIMDRIADTGLLISERTATNLAQCSKDLGQNWMQKKIPVYIQRSIHSIVTICNCAAHETKLSEDVRIGEAPYLLRSSIYELLNIIIWCRNLPSPENRESTHFEILGMQAQAENEKKAQKTASTPGEVASKEE